MIAVQILEPHDFVYEDDWCRPLSLCTMSGGHSDDYSFKSMYSGTPENNVEWVRVGAVLGEGWIGCTVKEINKRMMRYEFIRGDIPKSHCLDMSDYTDLSKIR